MVSMGVFGRLVHISISVIITRLFIVVIFNLLMLLLLRIFYGFATDIFSMILVVIIIVLTVGAK